MRPRKKIQAEAKASPIRQMRRFSEEIASSFGKKCSLKTLKRILRQANMTWKRLRNSLKKQRDENAFRQFEKELKHMMQKADIQQYDLLFFDETGFNLQPNVPYAWQERGKTYCLPAQRGGGVTVLGWLNVHRQQFDGAMFDGPANADCVVAVLDGLAERIERKTILILDNASIHTAKIVDQKRQDWEQKGLILKFLPAYSPELNLIEILWKQVKHFRLEMNAYQSIEKLKNAIIKELKSYGKEWRISFG